ncbi:MAG: hypothetical protein CL608_15880 [Anaerolineaceae bacterium]|nr:hypothetical protein [Anaerolineaceae bacterium]
MNPQQKARTLAILGGITVAAVWIALELLFSPDPTYLDGIVAGLAAGVTWYFGSQYFNLSFDNK